MHRGMRDQLENILSGSGEASRHAHLAECGECRDEIAAMQKQAESLRALRARSDAEPRAGFYARVMERIEAQGPGSIWSLFFDSPFGRRIAIASLALALCLGVYLVSSEQNAEQIGGPPELVLTDVGGQPQLVVTDGEIVPGSNVSGAIGPGAIPGRIPGEDQPGLMLTGTPDRDSVLVNLVTYREQ